MACAWLVECGLEPELQDEKQRAITGMVRTGLNSPVTTSAGRLFDAVAALCGIRSEVTYEGQAAVELEAACDLSERSAYPMTNLDARETVAAVVADLRAGIDVGRIAMRFHRALASATAEACAQIGIPQVVLSGGVFQNRVLLELTIEELQQHNLTPLLPQLLPPNDGAISYGQAAITAACSA
jgi:hydrogenase maturation protein HypF